MKTPGITTAATTVVALAVFAQGLTVPGASATAPAVDFSTVAEPAISNSTGTKLVSRGELMALDTARRRRKGGRRRERGKKNNKVECPPEPCAFDCDLLWILATWGASCLICHVMTDCPMV
ncbi:uncharacterized protein PpBr36_09258 [Pyricularia pennisetigena]|uniref:uncharacterized protein n=1 Tax=Pyricularia pennisetigena TaxID=1578925 RepID=UPI001153D355|nr:uncharacterized protein PpBr36_09258 [Pyricularia pennisetigena]TLS21731.1 hypothetical protein PpBr36_09258 [Pyricularia pennisetigena]